MASDRLKSVSQEEFVTLMLRHETRVRSFLAVIMGAVGTDLDDVFQGVCLVAWRKLSKFRYRGDTPSEEFVRWMCTIARYEALQQRDKLKSAKLLYDAELLDQLASFELYGSDYAVDSTEDLSRCINHLSERDRNLLTLRYREEKTVAEIAATIERTSNGVYKALSRIREKLLICLKRSRQAE